MGFQNCVILQSIIAGTMKKRNGVVLNSKVAQNGRERRMKMSKKFYSHYDWLEENLCEFLGGVGIENPDCYGGFIAAHGDKAYQYRDLFESNGVHFYHGVAIYLLSYIRPFSDSVRDTRSGWVSFEEWFVGVKDSVFVHLPSIRENHDN
jgi:hypothetical protein